MPEPEPESGTFTHRLSNFIAHLDRDTEGLLQWSAFLSGKPIERIGEIVTNDVPLYLLLRARTALAAADKAFEILIADMLRRRAELPPPAPAQQQTTKTPTDFN